ncbi:DASH family cryptochrome [Psychroserpens sp.]|uniref:DASH family cryptochrome n=1 Tax=Psychroserpens sp. TaxID=2020870 RepID=UPI001B068AB8|nr:DASH family cryptochrome [Psychroserpens sp.]MBO6607546.1 DASH family cryptochrome [Psychroserpens sp.]MBO6632372.1 DASH family cryptochrome [Psychroserpens sp.]MBO6655206.1 DASH family cryptochrome [Psychroserpens sp.]MBO6683204.1 DASH family cryptochrome [Psychroserpens sp.]MBO6749768.1 DASH family cryptochrome [Psychroserpens sp.]
MQKKQNNIGLVWFRNDLRVQDNAVLQKAIADCESIIACYCFDPRHYEMTKYGFKKTERFRAQFIIESVHELRKNLKELNVELFVFHEYPEVVLEKLTAIYSVKNIYLQNEWTSEEINVLDKVKNNLPAHIAYHEIYDQFLFHPEDIPMAISEIPQVFTVFRKKVEKYRAVRPSITVATTNAILEIENHTTIPDLSDLGLSNFEAIPDSAFPFKGGESQALERLNDYFFKTKKLGVYKKTRNGLIGKDFSSKFSPWLANGCISARTIYHQVKRFERDFFKNQSTYWLIFELIWRDYFKYVSLKHENAIFKIGGILHKDYEWKSDERLINSWINGETRSNFVNANMIELKKTGWMSNRGRQNVGSFLAKDLFVDWRIGAAYFEAMLIDYDVHSNYGNWMYVAGVGNDPRDRKFNVDLQAERYDANGKFQRMWLQETLF